MFVVTGSDAAFVSCLPLVLQLEEDGDVILDSLWWSLQGGVVTFSCVRGTYFVEGGTSRTVVCSNGVWPAVSPRCTGLVYLHSPPASMFYSGLQPNIRLFEYYVYSLLFMLSRYFLQ